MAARRPPNAHAAPTSLFLPSPFERGLFSLIPLTLVGGTIYRFLAPSTRRATYDYAAQSFEPATAPSYFARKDNAFNLFFVKIGWLWATAAFALLIFTHPSFGPPLVPSLTRRRAQALARYAAITAAWAAMTQWFFGAALIDRSFRWTGGACALVDDHPAAARDELGDAGAALTHAACKAIGGTWAGGHDISGHVFLLILASSMLTLELMPALLKKLGMHDDRFVLGADGTQWSVYAVNKKYPVETTAQKTAALGLGVPVATLVAGLSWWMLLMTAAFFHTWFEKLTGALAAAAAVYVVYVLPRGVPPLRALLGVPGV